MKKPFIYSLALMIAFSAPAFVSAAMEPLTPSTSTQQQTGTSGPEQSFPDIDALKDQPIGIRRIIVAGQLEEIRLKLSVLYDKTKFAANRLAQNGIDTVAADSAFAIAASALADAKTTIDSLMTAANDPANKTAETVTIGSVSFKDTVTTAESKLRNARDAIIAALDALKTAVTPAPAAAE